MNNELYVIKLVINVIIVWSKDEKLNFDNDDLLFLRIILLDISSALIILF